MKILEIIGIMAIGYVTNDIISKLKASSPTKSLNISRVKKGYLVYKDVFFSSKENVKKFKEHISEIFNLQCGYITTYQFMCRAKMIEDPLDLNDDQKLLYSGHDYGWTTLDGFHYEHTKDGWLVSMPYPVKL